MSATTATQVPADWPVQPATEEIVRALPRHGWATCGACGLTWDDSTPTSMTPAPSGRCPFEPFHDDEPDHAARRPFPTITDAEDDEPIDCPTCDGTGHLRYAERVVQNRGAITRTSDGTLWIDSAIHTYADEGDDEWLECSYCLAQYEMPEEYEWS